MGVVVLTLAILAARLFSLCATAEPLGDDGYFYVVQVETFLREGHFHARDGSWVLLLLTATASVAGDVIVGIKLGAALCAAALVPSSAFLLWQTFAVRGVRVASNAALLGALLLSLSATGTTWMAEFPKNLGALPVALVALGMLLRAQRSKRGRDVIVAVVLLVLAATAHKLGAVLAAVIVTGVVGSALLEGRRAARPVLVAAMVVVLLFVLLTALLPNLLHPTDVVRLEHEGFRGRWPGPFFLFSLRRFSSLETLELILAVPAWAIAALCAVQARGPVRAFFVVACGVLTIGTAPVWDGTRLDLGYRLALLAAIFGVLVMAAAGAWLLQQREVKASVVVVVGLVLLIVLARTQWAAHGSLVSPPPWQAYRALLARIPDDDDRAGLLIVHTPLNALFHHERGRETLAWAPEPALPREHIRRVAFGIRRGEWAAARAAHPELRAPLPLGEGYDLVEERLWEVLVKDAEAAGDDELLDRIRDPRNPRAVRPASLLRNQASHREISPPAKQ